MLTLPTERWAAPTTGYNVEADGVDEVDAGAAPDAAGFGVAGASGGPSV